MRRISAALMALSGCWMASGCGGNSGTGAGGGSSSSPAIKVTILGLPGGTPAAVTLSGPSGFNQQLTSSQTVNVAKGTYTITAAPLTHGGAIYEPAQVLQTATASDSSSTDIDVKYAVLAYSYSSIDYPGAVSTVATGINNNGEVIGYYLGTDGNYHGFTDSAGAFASLDCPPDTSEPGVVTETWLSGLNDQGQIVGSCLDAYPPYSPQQGGFNGRGFLYDRGSFTPINYPNALDTGPAGINAKGVIVGTYEISDTNPEGNSQGFSYSAGTYTSIDFAGANDTEIEDINSSGQMCGYQVTYGVSGMPGISGLIYSSGNFTGLNISGIPYSLNDFGQIVGYYNPTTTTAGFLSMNAILVEVLYPGSAQTFAYKVNNNAQIVGFYSSSSQAVHGFLATPIQ